MNVKAYDYEVDVAAPLPHASLKARKPLWMEWKEDLCFLVHDFIFLVDVEKKCNATRLLASKNKLTAEGAGAATVAATPSDIIPLGEIICVISGGNIDMNSLVKNLNHKIS